MSDVGTGDIVWGPTIRARLLEERGRKARVERSLASLKNQTGLYANEHRRLIAMQDEIIALIERHAAPEQAGLSEAEKAAQAKRCPCRGVDDYCPCQNVPDGVTAKQRANHSSTPGDQP